MPVRPFANPTVQWVVPPQRSQFQIYGGAMHLKELSLLGGEAIAFGDRWRGDRLLDSYLE